MPTAGAAEAAAPVAGLVPIIPPELALELGVPRPYEGIDVPSLGPPCWAIPGGMGAIPAV
jgi:hypothetical protein